MFNHPTDFHILPLSANEDMTITKTVSAVARGYVIYDDEGVATMPSDFARFEFYMIKDDQNPTFKITIENTGTKKKGDKQAEHEKIGNINILWASKSGVDKITKATITANGATTTVDVKVDDKSNTLTIPLTTDKVSYLLWDVTQIDLA